MHAAMELFRVSALDWSQCGMRRFDCDDTPASRLLPLSSSRGPVDLLRFSARPMPSPAGPAAAADPMNGQPLLPASAAAAAAAVGAVAPAKAPSCSCAAWCMPLLAPAAGAVSEPLLRPARLTRGPVCLGLSPSNPATDTISKGTVLCAMFPYAETPAARRA